MHFTFVPIDPSLADSAQARRMLKLLGGHKASKVVVHHRNNPLSDNDELDVSLRRRRTEVDPKDPAFDPWDPFGRSGSDPEPTKVSTSPPPSPPPAVYAKGCPASFFCARCPMAEIRGGE